VGGSLSLKEMKVAATVNGELPTEDPYKLAVIR
jgi:hypothetical protein